MELTSHDIGADMYFNQRYHVETSSWSCGKGLHLVFSVRFALRKFTATMDATKGVGSALRAFGDVGADGNGRLA